VHAAEVTFGDPARGETMTSMREGDLLGLRWADVDLDASAFHVTRKLKRRTSRRQVLLVGVAVQALKLHHDRQDDERRHAGSTRHREGLVFPTPSADRSTRPTSSAATSTRC
jgi:integrase